MVGILKVVGGAAAVWLLVAVVPARGSEPVISSRLAVPAADAVARSRELIRAAYEADYAVAKKSGDPAALLGKLRGAVDDGNEPARKYAFLIEAESLATEHDDAVATLSLVDKRTEMFQLDWLDERAKALARLARPKSVSDMGLYEQATATATTAVEADRFDIATESAALAVEVARAIDREQKAALRRQSQRRPAGHEAVPRANGADLIKRAEELQAVISEQKKHFDDYLKAKTILDSNPDDLGANATAGTYLCLVAQRWQKGLPHLMKSGITTLSGLAGQELALGGAASADAAKVFVLAGKWWDASQDTALIEGGGDAIRSHAGALYAGVLDRLEDPLEKSIAQNRARQRRAGTTTKPNANTPWPDDVFVWTRTDNAYKVFREVLSWHDAKRRCEDMGGHLVTIQSAEEQAFVWGGMQQSDAAGEADYLWGGATDEKNLGTWAWVDGKGMTYTAWASGQPHHHAVECVYLKLTGREQGRWISGPATGPAATGFICEWESEQPAADGVGVGSWTFKMPTDVVICGKTGNTYKVFEPSRDVSWSQAKQLCSSMGGQLVIITSPEEQDFVKELLGSATKSKRLLAGAWKMKGTKEWRWHNSIPVSYSAWAEGHPVNDEGELCLALDVTSDGAWTAQSMAEGHAGFICEWERTAVGANIARNGGFEEGSASWSLRGEPKTTIVKGKDMARTGEAACVVSGTTEGHYGGFYQAVPLSCGDKVTVTFWAEIDASFLQRVQIGHTQVEVWSNGAHVMNGALRPGRTLNGWQFYSGTMQIPDKALPDLRSVAEVGVGAFMGDDRLIRIDDVEIRVEHH